MTDAKLAEADALIARYRASPVYVVDLPIDEETAAAARLHRRHLVRRPAVLAAEPRALCGIPLPPGFRLLPYPPDDEPGPCRRCAAQLALLERPVPKGDRE